MGKNTEMESVICVETAERLWEYIQEQKRHLEL